MGTGLLGVTGRDLPELDPLHSNEYRRGGQWIANFLVSWTFPMLDKNQYLTDTFNHGMAYWIYGVMGILAALFIWKFVPETKGKTLEEMEGYWKR